MRIYRPRDRYEIACDLADYSQGGLSATLAGSPSSGAVAGPSGIEKDDRVRVFCDTGTLFADAVVRDVGTQPGSGREILRLADRDVACKDDALSHYEEAVKLLRNAGRDIAGSSRSRKTSFKALNTVLRSHITSSLGELREHLRERHGFEADVYVEAINPVNRKMIRSHQGPDGYRLLASSQPGTANPSDSLGWESAPHLKDLWSYQGAPVQDQETDWLGIDAPLDRCGISYQAGFSVAIRQGLIPPEPETGNQAPDITGFVTVLNRTSQRPFHLFGPLHTTRTYAYHLTSLWNTYDLAKSRLAFAHPMQGFKTFVRRTVRY